MTKRTARTEHQQQAAAQAAVLKEGLPHLYGWKWFPWSKAFFDSTNKMNLLVASNQSTKSSSQIRKCIDWATNQRKWPLLWPNRRPLVFWYLYPSKDVATAEFENKWVPEFMPRGAFKDDPIFGWEEVYDKKQIHSIKWKSGITVFFKAYTQGPDVLQSMSVDAVFTDEELPEELYSELKARLFATDGYFHMVFTATLNQDMWRRAIEGKGDQELFPEAFKQQITMYDCMYYTDGSPSPWTEDRIEKIVASCKDQTEVQRRVMGRFVAEHGRTYPAFDPVRHFMKAVPLPDNWRIYAGVDSGTGGHQNHPAAICFVAVAPDNKLGYVFKGWRGDGIVTVASDILEKFREMKGTRPITQQVYDWHAKDFGIIATRAGEPFTKANKEREGGIQITNTLFRNDMLFIFDDQELRKLGSELTSLMVSTSKSYARDDFADCLRYCLLSIPWDFSGINLDDKRDEPTVSDEKEAPLSPEEELREQIRARRGERDAAPADAWGELDNDFSEWNDAYGT